MFPGLQFVATSFLSILAGMKVTMKNIFVPAVTLQYPAEKRAMADRFRGMVDLVPEKCITCYQCIKICPVAALDLAHKQGITPDNKRKTEIVKFTFNGELCCFCGFCREVCPTSAIYLNKMYEVAVFSHGEINNIDLTDPKKYQHLENNRSR